MTILEDEAEALHAMWGNDFHRDDHKFSIIIGPLEEDKFTIIELNIRVDLDYPNIAPDIFVRRVRGGFETELMIDLRQSLYNESRNLIGEPMMIVLSLLTQEWCIRYNLSDTLLGRQWQAEHQQQSQQLTQEHTEERTQEMLMGMGTETLELSEPVTFRSHADPQVRRLMQPVKRKSNVKKAQHTELTSFQQFNFPSHIVTPLKPSWIELEARRVEQSKVENKEGIKNKEDVKQEDIKLHEICDLVEQLRLIEPYLTRKELMTKISKKMEFEGRESNVKRWHIEKALSNGLYKDQVCVVCLERTIPSDRHIYQKCNHPNHWVCNSCHNQMHQRGQPHCCPLCRRHQ